MNTLHVFDMDGTLYDKLEANRQAYTAAGLTDYKDEYFCQTAKAWGCPPKIHSLKTQLFPSFSYLISRAWALPFFEIAEKNNKAIVLTGSSPSSVETVTQIHGRPLPTPFGITLSETQKRSILINLHTLGWKVIYYDDNVPMGVRITEGYPIQLVTPGHLESMV